MSGQTNLQKRTILPSSCTSPGLPTEKTLTYQWVSAGGGARYRFMAPHVGTCMHWYVSKTAILGGSESPSRGTFCASVCASLRSLCVTQKSSGNDKGYRRSGRVLVIVIHIPLLNSRQDSMIELWWALMSSDNYYLLKIMNIIIMYLSRYIGHLTHVKFYSYF